MFDNLRDLGDLWSELSYSDKRKAQESFSAALTSLSEHSLRGYQAGRVGRLVGGAPAGRAPIPFTVVYFALVPIAKKNRVPNGPEFFERETKDN